MSVVEQAVRGVRDVLGCVQPESIGHSFGSLPQVFELQLEELGDFQGRAIAGRVARVVPLSVLQELRRRKHGYVVEHLTRDVPHIVSSCPLPSLQCDLIVGNFAF